MDFLFRQATENSHLGPPKTLRLQRVVSRGLCSFLWGYVWKNKHYLAILRTMCPFLGPGESTVFQLQGLVEKVTSNGLGDQVG